MENVFSIEHLEKHFGDHKVLLDVNLSVNKGEVISIIGSSGSGKSTMLSIIGGIDVATSGNVVVDNFSLKDLSPADLDRYRNNYVGFDFEGIN